MTRSKSLFEQAIKLKNELRLSIQVEVNKVNNNKLSFVTNQIMSYNTEIDFNIYSSLHRCGVDKVIADEISEMLVEYVEICDLVNRISKLRK